MGGLHRRHSFRDVTEPCDSISDAVLDYGNIDGVAVHNGGGFLRRRGDERGQARLWRERFRPDNTGARRNVRPRGLALLCRAVFLSLRSLLLHKMDGVS